MQQVTEAVNAIHDMNIHVASAAEQHTAVTEENNRNISCIDNVTEENTRSTQTTIATSNKLAELATQLQNPLNRFRV